MTDDPRGNARDAFLTGAGWAGARRTVLAGDASNRRYDRLTDPATGARAVLMDAPPDSGEDVRPFLAIGTHLRRLGLSAPEVLAQDPAAGFLLLEDLGDDLYARVIAGAPQMETPLYEAAVDLLARLHAAPPPDGLAAYDISLMADLAALAVDWYLPAATGAPPEPGLRKAFQAETETVLAQTAPDHPTIALRDFHAENLIWLPERTGAARVGLLDFQDALRSHPAYDLVSLLEDARRDVAPEVQEAMLARYIAATGHEETAFRAAYAALGAQRNLRILGVFARLCLRDGKAAYVDLVPRVWAHLQHDLTHPALAGLKAMVDKLPAPTPDILARIAARAGTRPRAAMVFAAGLGSRMGALTAERPKPLIEVAGKPLIDHALDQIAGARLPRTVVNTHYLAGQVRAHLAGHPGITISHEETLLDTGGGLRHALPMLGKGAVYTHNSDAVWTGQNPLIELAAAWNPDRMDALLLLVPKDRATGHTGAGDFMIGPDGRLTRGPGMVYTGAQILQPEGLRMVPEEVFSLNLMWDAMLLDERVYGVVHDGGWCDVGRPEGIAQAEAMLAGDAHV